ncbi:MAG: sel1 repeat family protein [Burkholderiales bacterium]|nr:sel1 repeat family protein [Burkholderiales bacterium]
MIAARALAARMARLAAWAALAIGLLHAASAVAGLEEGLSALARRDYEAARKELLPLAERGNPEAQYRIGRMHEFGAGFPASKAQGIEWYRKAATGGNSSAQQELGVLYSNGDGVPKDEAQAVTWFQKAAAQDNATAQFNLGLMFAKGAGVKRDAAQALSWFRKAAAQGFPPAQLKLGVAYEHGEAGVAKDPALAYANYAIAARGGNAEYVAARDRMAGQVAPAEMPQARAAAEAWQPGQPLPTRLAAASPRENRCSASGQLEGARFNATHCAVSFLAGQNSVAIWFSEAPIAPQEAEDFQMSSYAQASKGGKPRTLVQIMLCPGGGKPAAAPGAVKSIDFNTNHASAPLAGMQTVLDAGKDYKVERLAGEVKPGGNLSGRITGSRGKTSFALEFDVTLPAKEAAAGMSCK